MPGDTGQGSGCWTDLLVTAGLGSTTATVRLSLHYADRLHRHCGLVGWEPGSAPGSPALLPALRSDAIHHSAREKLDSPKLQHCDMVTLRAVLQFLPGCSACSRYHYTSPSRLCPTLSQISEYHCRTLYTLFSHRFASNCSQP